MLEQFERGEISETACLAENRRLVDRAREEYGTIPQGEKAVADVRMAAKVTDDKQKGACRPFQK